MRSREKAILGYINTANCITLLGLLLSLTSCYFALNLNIKMSAVFLIISGICDLFDGAVARKIKRTDAEKEFGVQLDTVADVVNFGITPVIIVLAITGTAWYALIIYVFYVICAVNRLAYFNTTAVPDTPVTFYRGLPVTYIALILPVALLFQPEFTGVLTLAVTGILYVINIKVPKPRGIWYVLFPVISVVLIITWCFI